MGSGSVSAACGSFSETGRLNVVSVETVVTTDFDVVAESCEDGDSAVGVEMGGATEVDRDMPTGCEAHP
jgi:hypothetical protein